MFDGGAKFCYLSNIYIGVSAWLGEVHSSPLCTYNSSQRRQKASYDMHRACVFAFMSTIQIQAKCKMLTKFPDASDVTLQRIVEDK